MVDEIRSYHFDPQHFAAYKVWARAEAVPFLKANLDVVGFWFASSDESEIKGRTPMKMNLGTANVTWIIRWASMEERRLGHERVFQSAGWRDIWSRHPDPEGYLQTEARFAEEV